MAVGRSAAVVVRAREPEDRNLIIQAQGFNHHVVRIAAEEAAFLLQQASLNQDNGEVSRVMQGLPYVTGTVGVMQGRYRVAYRFIGQLLMLVVTPANGGNPILAMDLLDRCTRVITCEHKYDDLSVNGFKRIYKEAQMGLASLLSEGGAITGGRAVLNGSTAYQTIAAISGKGRKESNSGAANEKDKDSKDSKAAEGREAIPQKPPYKTRRRTLLGQSAKLPIPLGFPTSDGVIGLRPVPGFEVTTDGVARGKAPAQAAHQLPVMPQEDDIFAALKPTSNNAQDGSPLDDMLGPPTGNKQTQAGPKKGEDPFAFVEGLVGDRKSQQPAGPPPPPVPPKPLLRLVETYRAEIKGSAVARVGHVGEVSCLPDLHSTTIPVIGFALQFNAYATQSVPEVQAVHGSLQQVRVLQSVVQQGWPAGYQPSADMSDQGGEAELEGFTAHVTAARSLLNPVLVKYALPASSGALPPPVRLRLDASLQPCPSSPDTAVMLGLQLQLADNLKGAIAGLEIKLHVPSLYDLPSRVRPIGAKMDGSRRILKWALPNPDPLAALASDKDDVSLDMLCAGPAGFSAVFMVSGSMAAAKGALRSVMAEVEVKGVAGKTLSGIMLRQHGFAGQAGKAAAENCSWKAQVTARCV